MKKNISLIIGLAIPIIMIIVVSIAIYVPSVLAHPQYSFLYSTGNNYYNAYGYNTFNVVNGKIVKQDVPAQTDPNGKILPPVQTQDQKLYIYDPIKSTNTSVSFADAQKYTLDPTDASPDGYKLDRGSSGGDIFGFFGGSSDYNSWYLRKGSVMKKVINTNDPFNNYNFQFLGWVINK